MAPPAPRRFIRLDEGELHDVARMSPKVQKEWTQILVMRGDLGPATANTVKYGEGGNSQTASKFTIPRQCDRRDTKEAEIASQNKPRLAGWNSFHKTVDSLDLPADEPRNLHGHRAKVRQELREEAVNLGLNSVAELSLEDTYDHPRGGGRGKKSIPTRSKFSKAPFPRPTKQFAAIHFSQSKGPPKGKRGNAEQARPWPPPALVGAPGVAPVMKHYLPTPSPATKKMAGMPAGGQFPTKAARIKAHAPAVSQPWNASLATPSDFMSAATIQSSQKPYSINNKGVAPNINGGKDVPTTSSAEATRENISTDLKEPAVRLVPVVEFSFPAVAALAPGEIDTHTDGALTPGTLSGFSTITETPEEVSFHTEPQSNDLIGLGIENIDFDNTPAVLEVQTSLTAPAQVVGFSPSGNIMDSPILDDVTSEVLAAGPGNILEVAGRKYIAMEDLLALRDAIDKKINAAMASGISGFASPSEHAVVASAQPSSAPSTTTSSDATTVIPAARANPFAPREPLGTNNANMISTTAPNAELKKNVPTVDSIKASTTTRRPPVTSSTKIFSKWDDDAPPAATRKDIPAAEPAKTLQSSRAGPFTSNTQVFSKWATETPSPSSPRRAATPVRAPSPIFGDRKTFGHMSEEARKGQDHTPPSTNPVSKRKTYIQPGAGYAWLMQELAAAKVDDDSNK